MGMSSIIGGQSGISALAEIFGANSAKDAITSSTDQALGYENAATKGAVAQMAPYTSLGQSAIPTLQALLGIGSGKGNSASALQALQQTPGYQFTQQQGDQATLNAATATGMLGSGNTLEALDQYNSGLASQTYQNALSDYEGVAGMGQSAAGTTGGFMLQGAGTMAGLAANQGENLANIDAGLASAIAGTGSNATNALTLNNLASSLQANAANSNVSLNPGDIEALQDSLPTLAAAA